MNIYKTHNFGIEDITISIDIESEKKSDIELAKELFAIEFKKPTITEKGNTSKDAKSHYNIYFNDECLTLRADYATKSDDDKFINFYLDIDDEQAKAVACVQANLIKYIIIEYK